jgi:hypothetical protein
MSEIRNNIFVSDFIIYESGSISKNGDHKLGNIIKKPFAVCLDTLDEKLSDQRLQDLELKKEELIPACEVFEEFNI